MSRTGRLNPYTEIHKAVRQALFETEMRLGSTDWTDAEAIPGAVAAWRNLTALLRDHVENEHNFVHPIYERKLPGVARSLNADHEEQEAFLRELDGHFDRLLEMPPDDARVAMGLELYRALSRFIADYLPHLLREEGVFLRNLWDVCSEEEIADMLAAIIAAESPESAVLSGEFILRASNHQDLRSLMEAISGRVPAPVIEGMMQMAQQFLPPRELQKLAPAPPG
ncbi:MAG TPA: hemerythrin domain-containing protein [Armatimonadota bacterium]